MFAGQLTQESRFNPNAHSSVGAQGLAQFMPQTSAWLTQVAPKDFPTANALDPEWSIRALVYYDYWLFARVPLFRDSDVPSSRWGASLASYNGGLGWTLKDQKLATCDRSLWWACVAGVTDGRTVSNITQYHNYPVLIMKRWMPLYVTAGWN
jgi:soluble lytic murein transglycosylase-like protein